jgi:hypothetical protein
MTADRSALEVGDMDWLEDYVPFLRELDQGNGALEVALVLLIVVVLAWIGLTVMRRSRLKARHLDEPLPDRPREGHRR